MSSLYRLVGDVVVAEVVGVDVVVVAEVVGVDVVVADDVGVEVVVADVVGVVVIALVALVVVVVVVVVHDPPTGCAGHCNADCTPSSENTRQYPSSFQ